MIDANDVFNPKDFESIRLVVDLQNFTTHTEIKNSNKASLQEIGDRELTLELPAKSCNVSHNVLVKISRPEKRGGTVKTIEVLNVTGKVREITENDDDSIRVVVDCVQFDEKSWNSLLALYSSRQDEINNFLKTVKP